MRRIGVLLLGILFGIVLLGNAGPRVKKTVAVFDFQNDSGVRAWGDIGRDFSMQLADALVKSGQFIVLERKDLDVVMAEQDLASSDRFAKSRTARKGKIIPAQILIKGRITEFERNTSSSGQGLSIKGFSIGAKRSSAHIAVIIQLIDSTTGEIIDSQRVEGKANSGGLSIGYDGDFSIGSSSFKKTPLGKAVQLAIDRAVNYISQRLKDVPWKGRVVLVKGNKVYINAGRKAGVQVGDEFFVYKEGEPLIDPDTGMELGSELEKVAKIRVKDVKDKYAIAQVVEGSPKDIQKAYLVMTGEEA